MSLEVLNTTKDIERKRQTSAPFHSSRCDQYKKFNGPLSGEMWSKVHALGSKMPDEFNWAIYDELYERFGDQQPRGGVVFKTGLKLVNHHSSCTKCHYAFEIDTYGRGCLHNCSYCYALESLTAHGFWNRPHPFPLDMSEVRKQFFTVFETDKPSRWRNILQQKVPLRIGSMSDSFMKIDMKFGVTRELLKILSFYNYPYVVFTRSDLIAREEYLSILRRDLCSIQFSISGNDEQLTRLIEPGAPSVAARLAALKVLGRSGFWTTVRINPFFPMHPDGFFTDPDSLISRFGSISNIPKFGFFDWTMIAQLKESLVPSFLVGVARLSPHAIKSMSRVTGVDLKSFFKPDRIKGNYDVRYSSAEVAKYYELFKEHAEGAGIRFSTCYIGMGIQDYYRYQHLWSNRKDCCDAKGNVAAILRSSQDVNWDERIKHAPNKETALMAMSETQREEYTDEQFKNSRPTYPMALEQTAPLG